MNINSKQVLEMKVNLLKINFIVNQDDLRDDWDSEEEIYSSDEDAKIEESEIPNKHLTLANIKIKPTQKTAKNYDRSSIVDENDISIDMRTDTRGDYKSLVYLEKASNILETNMQRDDVTSSSKQHISAALDIVQVDILKIRFMLGFGDTQAAFNYFYSRFSDEKEKAQCLDIYTLEAEVLLKYSDDYEKAKKLLNNVLEHDNLNFRALCLYSYSYMYYEGNYQKALDFLLRAKLINPKSWEVWNLLGNWYRLIDGNNLKAEECFLQEYTVKLEYPDAIQILEIIPSRVSW